jgi:hypothetical protein
MENGSTQCQLFTQLVSTIILIDLGTILDTTDWMTRVQSLAGAKDFSSNLCIQTSSGAQPATYPVGTRGLFPRGKAWLGHDSDHSPPSSAEVENQ